jgi:hypothetical protein
MSDKPANPGQSHPASPSKNPGGGGSQQPAVPGPANPGGGNPGGGNPTRVNPGQ